MRFLGILLLTGLLLSCSVQQNTAKSGDAMAQLDQLNELINSGNFDFSAYRATISKLGPVELTGNYNYLRFKNDSVFAELPFFGERYMGGGYGGDGGIAFDGTPENLSITKNEKKRNINIDFSISDNQERYDVTIRVYPNQSTTVDVNSSQRSYISFRGRVTPSKEKS